MDMEKVIKGLENIVSDMQEEIDEWRDYSDSELSHGLTCDCEWWYNTAQILKAALALLKAQEAQEAVKPIMDIDTWVCGKCGTRVERQSMAGPNVLIAEQLDFCPNCGRAVKWDG